MHNEPAYQGFRYMPAGVCLDHYALLTVYVRYVNRRSKDIKIKQKTNRFIWLECPDRDIVIGSDNHFDDAFNPHGFDEAVTFNLLDSRDAKSLGLNYVMPNFVHDNTEKGSAEARTKGQVDINDPDSLTILSDSGGYQYLTGISDFIDPRDLGRWYNKNVDCGMTLDVPLSTTGPGIIEKAAALQNRNTRLIRSVLEPHVELINITHGRTLAERNRYRDLIEAEHGDLNRLALGGLGMFGSMRLVDVMMDTAYTGKRYKQYHLLGLTRSEYFPLFIAMANYGDNAPHLTADSTSHKQAANMRQFYGQAVPGCLRSSDLGLKLAPPNSAIHLSCNCPVCSLIKYRDILGILPGQFAISLLSIHNILQTTNYVNLVDSAFKSMDPVQFIDFIRETHATHSPQKSKAMVQALEFILRSVDEGHAKARKRYKAQLEDTATHMFGDAQKGLGIGKANSEVRTQADELKRLNDLIDSSNVKLDEIEGVKTKTRKRRKAA